MEQSKAPRFAELPDILTPRDLIKYLPIGRDSIYEALRSQTIPNVRLGQKFIVTKAALREFSRGQRRMNASAGPQEANKWGT